MSDDIDDLVDWQMSQPKTQRAPRIGEDPQYTCPYCYASSWHGIATSICGGSNLTPVESADWKAKNLRHAGTPEPLSDN